MDEVQFPVLTSPGPVKLLEPTMAAKGRIRSAGLCGPTLSWWKRYALACRKPLS